MPELFPQKPRVTADAFQQIVIIFFGKEIDAAFVRFSFYLRGGEAVKLRFQKIMTAPPGVTIRCLRSVPLS